MACAELAFLSQQEARQLFFPATWLCTWLIALLISLAACTALRRPNQPLLAPDSTSSLAATLCCAAAILAPWSIVVWRQLRPRLLPWSSSDLFASAGIFAAAVFGAIELLTCRRHQASVLLILGTTICGLAFIITAALLTAWAIITLAALLFTRAAWRWEGWVSRAAVLLLALPSLVISFGFDPVIREVKLQVAGLTPEAEGYKLCHLSDLHAGPQAPAAEMKRIASLTLPLGCRAIIVNGDAAEGTVAERAAEMSELVAELVGTTPDGTYYVPGNHEFYNTYAPGGARKSAEEWTKWWDDRGFKSLNNSHVQVPLNGAKWLTLAGVDDILGAPDLAQALANRPIPSLPTVLLAHRPWPVLRQAAEAKVSVQISGHTHAGQIWPLHLPVWKSNHGYVSGLYEPEGGPVLYVSDGTIGTYATRLRLFSRAEITVATFVSGPSADPGFREAHLGMTLAWIFIVLIALPIPVFLLKLICFPQTSQPLCGLRRASDELCV